MNIREEITTKEHTKLEVDLFRALEVAIRSLIHIKGLTLIPPCQVAQNALEFIESCGFEVE